MIWVGSFKSLQSALHKPRFTGTPLEMHTWLRSEIGLISPLVDWLMGLIAGSLCVRGKEEFVELALREQGHEVRLIPAQYVKPYVKTNKNDQDR